MPRVVALLAAVLLALLASSCGSGGAEPGASKEATLVLDFQPNAVHAGIYAALASGAYRDRGLDLTVRQPSASTDAPKFLAAGRARFAILEIHDLALARERGLDVVGISPIVDRPLAAVIAGDRASIRRPRDLEGETVGVTGLPSDDAVLDSVVSADGGNPSAVHRVTIGFQAISSLAAGKVAAATAFWNAEGVALSRQGVPTREFRVDDYGAPRYPELVLCTTGESLAADPGLVGGVADATQEGYAETIHQPHRALNALLDGVPDLDRGGQQAELRVLLRAEALPDSARFDRSTLRAFSRWEVEHDVLHHPLDVDAAFPSLDR